MKVSEIKIVGVIFTLVSALAGAPSAASQPVSKDYKAMQLDGKVLTTNGKYAYVIDPAALQATIDQLGRAEVKIYGTEIWLTVSRNGEIEVRKVPLKDTPYYVLAPLKDMGASNDSDVDYTRYAMGYTTTSSIHYPEKFCTGCAMPTALSKNLGMIVKNFVVAAKANEAINSGRKPGSL